MGDAVREGATEGPLEPEGEDEILSAWALRMDGYEYKEQAGFDAEAAVERFFSNGRWDHLAPVEKQATFFLLQRSLFKWALADAPRHGRYWRAFRSLFFEVVALEVPEALRKAELYEEWERRFLPRRQEHMALVRRIHETTAYEDDAPSAFSAAPADVDPEDTSTDTPHTAPRLPIPMLLADDERPFGRLADQLLDCLPGAHFSRTRDVIEVIAIDDEGRGVILLVTPDGVEIRLPRTQWVRPYLPIPSSRFWKRIKTHGPEDVPAVMAHVRRAQRAREREFRKCRHCGAKFPLEHYHPEIRCCHGCAERHEGVVH